MYNSYCVVCSSPPMTKTYRQNKTPTWKELFFLWYCATWNYGLLVVDEIGVQFHMSRRCIKCCLMVPVILLNSILFSKEGEGMKFKEKEAVNFTNVPTCFIYFLLFKKEVVYVGKTMMGLSRVYSHKTDKEFDEVYGILCEDEEELDYYEGYYILKYMPKYNKNYLTPYIMTVSQAVTKINKIYNSKINLHILNKMIIELNIKLKTIPNSDNYYITQDDFNEIDCAISDYKKGAPLSEIFNI